MATAQIVSATTALHDEKIDEQTITKPQEGVKCTDNQETTLTAPEPREDQLPKEPADDTVTPETELEPEAEPKEEPEVVGETKPESEVLAVEVEKVVLEGGESKVAPVDQPAKAAPEPCVEEEAKETKEPKVETQTEPTEVTKAEPETKPEAEAEPDEKADEKKEEVVTAE